MKWFLITFFLVWLYIVRHRAGFYDRMEDFDGIEHFDSILAIAGKGFDEGGPLASRILQKGWARTCDWKATQKNVHGTHPWTIRFRRRQRRTDRHSERRFTNTYYDTERDALRAIPKIWLNEEDYNGNWTQQAAHDIASPGGERGGAYVVEIPSSNFTDVSWGDACVGEGPVSAQPNVPTIVEGPFETWYDPVFTCDEELEPSSLASVPTINVNRPRGKNNDRRHSDQSLFLPAKILQGIGRVFGEIPGHTKEFLKKL